MNEVPPSSTTPFATVTKFERNPFSQNLNYTNQDYGSLKIRMMELIQQHFSKDFTDFSESSLAMMMIELWAFLADQLSFKIDQIANELFIDTVTETANIIRLANLVGFKPTPPTPAKAMFSISTNNIMSSEFHIDTPLEITFQGANGAGELHMELYPADEKGNPLFGNPITFPPGTNFVNNVVGIEGKTNHKFYDSSGLAWQQVPLEIPNVLWGSVTVYVDEVQWKEVEFFTGWKPLPEFRVEYLNNYNAVVIFGNNQTGLIPPKGSTVRVTYRIGGGSEGNIVTGGINRNIPIHVAGLRQMVTCAVSNYTKAEGGYNGDTIDDIRAKLPIYLKTQDRAVTGADYKALCEGFVSSTNGVIGKAAVSLRNHGCAGNVVDIYVLAQSGPIGLEKASEGLKAELGDELSKKKMFSDYVCIRDGEIILADLAINLVASSVNKQHEASIREKTYRRLGDLLSVRNSEFGQSLGEKDVVKALADVKEIEHVSVSFTTEKSIQEGHGSISSVDINFWQIVRPDNITINVVYKD